MLKRIQSDDLKRLFEYYQDPNYSEFFRRVPGNLNWQEFEDIEKITGGSFYQVAGGFAVLSDIDAFGSSCHIGFLLDKSHWDQKIGEKKIAFLMTHTFIEDLFRSTQLRKVSMRFLASRTDIAQSLKKGGFHKEADFQESVYFNGKFVDETEYAMTKKEFQEFYKCHF